MIASIAVGIAMFGTTVFLSQYMQIARGKSPTESGLLTIPMVVGAVHRLDVVGRLVSRDRPLQALHAARRGAAHGRPGADGHARRDDQPGRARRVHGRHRRRRRHADAEPRAGRAEHRPARGHRRGQRRCRVLPHARRRDRRQRARRAARPPRERRRSPTGSPTQGIDAGAAGGRDQVPDVGALPAPVAHVVEHAYGTGDRRRSSSLAAPLGLVALVALALMREVPLGSQERDRASPRAGRARRSDGTRHGGSGARGGGRSGARPRARAPTRRAGSGPG